MKTKSDLIMECESPWDNPYQGHYTRVLFVCSAGILRSATAANVFGRKGYNTRAAGSESYALIPVTPALLLWANKIIFLNPDNYTNTAEKFPLMEFKDKIQVCNISDTYDYMHPALVAELEEQVDL